jgi:methylenetetrahydrofolate reductase (NADPH)
VEAEQNLWATIKRLEPLAPSFVSVTYGAGGTTRERTHDLVVTINGTTTMTAMAHLTCAAHTRAELVEVVTRYRDAGVENVLALGGDPPKDLDLPPGELHHSIELVELIREIGDFAVGVAAHPEPHPRSPSLASDRAHTAEKLALADFAITQFFFDAAHYFDLVDSLRALGVDKPVIAGIMPATSLASIQRMTQLQGSEFPEWLSRKLHAVGDDPQAVRKVGIEEATKLCRELLAGGVPGLHFYTLNRSTATREIYEQLGLVPQP